MSESLNIGPNGIIPQQGWIHRLKVPSSKRMLFRFTFAAWYEHQIWICSVDTGNILVKKGNYLDTIDWVSENNNAGQDAHLAIVGYHKESPPDGTKPWIQSPMKVRDASLDGRVTVVGFDDSGHQVFGNAIVTATMLD